MPEEKPKAFINGIELMFSEEGLREIQRALTEFSANAHEAAERLAEAFRDFSLDCRRLLNGPPEKVSVEESIFDAPQYLPLSCVMLALEDGRWEAIKTWWEWRFCFEEEEIIQMLDSIIRGKWQPLPGGRGCTPESLGIAP